LAHLVHILAVMMSLLRLSTNEFDKSPTKITGV